MEAEPRVRPIAAAALQLSTGGLAAILATGRAPAFAQGTTIHWVRGSDYVPVSDQLIKTKLNEQAQKDLGLKINLEGVDGLTIQAPVTSSVQSGSGPVIFNCQTDSETKRIFEQRQWSSTSIRSTTRD